MKEDADGEDRSTWVVHGGVEQIGAWVVEDESGDCRLGCGEVGCERGPGAGAVGDDPLGRDGARGVEVLERGFGVVGHALLAGTDGRALAVTAVVKSEDVDAEIVKGGEDGDVVGQRAVTVGQEEKRQVSVAATWICGDPPAGELWRGGVAGVEAEEFVGSAADRSGW